MQLEVARTWKSAVPGQVLQLVVSVCPGNLVIYRVKQLLIHAVHSSSPYIMYPGMFQPLVGFVVSWHWSLLHHTYRYARTHARACTQKHTHTHTHTHTHILSHFDGTEYMGLGDTAVALKLQKLLWNTSKCHKNWRKGNSSTHVMTVIGLHLF